MPKTKHKNIGTSSLKVKPKKRPGLIKQLSQPFLSSNKKNKQDSCQEPVTLISARIRDDLIVINGYDDMFLPDKNRNSENVFLSPEREIETLLNFEQTRLQLHIAPRETCSSSDSGYTSPPLPELLSPTSTPAKGILKKVRSNSPSFRPDSPVSRPMSPVSRPMSPSINGLSQNGFPVSEPPMSPEQRPMSPCLLDLENALGILDDVLDLENNPNERAPVKKSVSFGELTEINKYSSDSNEKELGRSVSFGDIENLKKEKNIINESTKVKKSVSFEPKMTKISETDTTEATQEGTNLIQKSMSFESLSAQVNMSEPPTRTVSLMDVSQSTPDTSLSKKCVSMENMVRRMEAESVSTEVVSTDKVEECSCEDVCMFEVEAKLVLIQPLGLGHDLEGHTEGQGEICTELDKFNIMICHHPGCTQQNENRPMLLCKECDNSIHQRPDYSGHLVLDAPKRKTSSVNLTKFVSTPTLPHKDFNKGDSVQRDVPSDTEMEKDEGSHDDQTDGRVPMETDSRLPSLSTTEAGDGGKKLRRKKVVKAKRRHTTGQINHERFVVKFGLNTDDAEEVEIVAAVKNVTLREAIQPLLERRGMDLSVTNVFVEASNTPLPLNCETFLLGGTTMYVREKDATDTSTPVLPMSTQSLSKATGTKFANASKAQSAKTTKSGGSLRSRRGINLSIDDSSLPMALTSSISPQGTLRELESARKPKPSSKLTTLFSPLNKDKDKQDQLSDLLNTYSVQGLPSPPSLLQIGQPQVREEIFEVEADWRLIVNNSEKLSKRQHDQQEAIWELLQTELHFIQSIRVISDLFLCVLLNIQNDLLLNEIETEKLFSNIGEICNTNCDFWSSHLVKVLHEARRTSSLLNPTLMKEGFSKYHEMFQPYIKYCAKQKACLDYMRLQYTDNDLFKTFVVWAEAQKQCNRLKLTDLLVKPMQRLTKYSLLLQAILRKTDDEHQRKDLLEMIASVDRFVHHVNSTLHVQHEEEKLHAIVDKIESYDAVEAPNDECLKLIQQYNSNFNLTTPMPGCGSTQTRSLLMQSALKMKEYQNRMDVECLLFTDMLLICKANKRMDKYKIVRPPMRVDRLITHELKDKGCFLLIYVNEYHVPVSSFTFHGDQSAVKVWIEHIRKAQELYKEERVATSEARTTQKPIFSQPEIVSEEVISYTPLLISDNAPRLQLTRCSSEEMEHEGENMSINRTRSWNEMESIDRVSHHPSSNPATDSHELSSKGNFLFPSMRYSNSTSNSEPRLENVSTETQTSHQPVQYSQSDPTFVSNQGLSVAADQLQNPPMSVSSEADGEFTFPDLLDENMKSKYQRRQSRTEKRYFTADAIREIQKDENRDTSIYKRLSWNFPNGDLSMENKQGVLKQKTMSSDSIRSCVSSSGVSSTSSLIHLSPDDNINEEIENEEDFETYDEKDDTEKCVDELLYNVNEDDIKNNSLFPDSHRNKSKSTPDIVSLMQELNTCDVRDGISSVNLPLITDPNKKLSQAQLMRMKKQLLLSSNVEASEV